MGTPSAVAVQVGDSWAGRYCNEDGNPTWLGNQLIQIVVRDGLDRAMGRLCYEHFAWSHLQHNVKDDGLYPRGTPVEGYGVTCEAGSRPNEWITPEGDDKGAQWAYVLMYPGLAVYERRLDVSQDKGISRWKFRGVVPWVEAGDDKGLKKARKALAKIEEER